MKRLLAAAMLITVLALSEPIQAADLGGFYVAPKFFWSHQNQDSAKTESDYSYTYTSIGVGDKSDEAWGGALALGYDFKTKFGVPVRTELEYAVRSQSKVKTQAVDGPYIYDNTRKMNISTLFANAFYDINTGTKFTPYVGGGIGLASISVKDNFSEGTYGYSTASSRKTVSNFAWNLSAGVAYSFDSNWALDLGYRYSDFGKVSGSTATDNTGGYVYKAKSDVTAHEVGLGLRYTF